MLILADHMRFIFLRGRGDFILCIVYHWLFFNPFKFWQWHYISTNNPVISFIFLVLLFSSPPLAQLSKSHWTARYMYNGMYVKIVKEITLTEVKYCLVYLPDNAVEIFLQVLLHVNIRTFKIHNTLVIHKNIYFPTHV